MNSNYFLIAYGVVTVLLVVGIISLLKRQKPTELKVDGPSKKPLVYDEALESVDPHGHSTKKERPLNCLFMFNGHSFDAFEVLGLPAGSSKNTTLQAFKDFSRNTKETGEFLGALKLALDQWFAAGP